MTKRTVLSRCVLPAASTTEAAMRAFSLGLLVLVCFFFANIGAHADNIYVASWGAANGYDIVKFDSSGNSSVFANWGFSYPTGFAFEGSGNLYVADNDANIIVKFDPSGHRSVFADSSSCLIYPMGLAFDKSGNLYTVNLSIDNNILKFDSSGHGSVFAYTSGNGYNLGLAFDTNGNLYVAEDGGSIEEFDPNGSRSVFASTYLNNPHGLAFDSSGNLYVANGGNGDAGSQSIAKFDSSGHGSVLATSGLNIPWGLGFDSSGNLYVVNADIGTGTGSIEKFDSNGIDFGVFVSGLSNPMFIAIQVPEPATWSLLALGVIALLGTRRFHRHSL